MPRLRTEVERRFSDLDLMGHVNNVAFLVYLEEARVRLFAELGVREVQEMLRLDASETVTPEADAEPCARDGDAGDDGDARQTVHVLTESRAEHARTILGFLDCGLPVLLEVRGFA